MDAVLAALRHGMVDTLLVSGDEGDEEVVVAQDDPMLVARVQQTLADFGVQHVTTARLTDAAVVAALAGGADVVVVPEHGPNAPSGPLGALRRD